jgi:hypothetical protein
VAALRGGRTVAEVHGVNTRKRVKLFVVGVVLGMSMFFIGGIGVVPTHKTDEPTAQLQPWLQKTECNYPAVDCTSQGSVVTSPAVRQSPN